MAYSQRQKGGPKRKQNHGMFGILRTTQEPQNDDMPMVSNMVSTTKSPFLPSTSAFPWNSPSRKWGLFGETIFSLSRRQKKNQKSATVSSSQWPVDSFQQIG